MPTNQQVKKDILKDYLKDLVTAQQKGQVEFIKDDIQDREYGQDICLVYFCQQDFMQKL